MSIDGSAEAISLDLVFITRAVTIQSTAALYPTSPLTLNEKIRLLVARRDIRPHFLFLF